MTSSSPVGTAMTAPRPGSGGGAGLGERPAQQLAVLAGRAIRSGSLRRIRSAASAAATEAGSLAALKT